MEYLGRKHWGRKTLLLTSSLILAFSIPILGLEFSFIQRFTVTDVYLSTVNISDIERSSRQLLFRCVHYIVCCSIPLCLWGELAYLYYGYDVCDEKLFSWLPSSLPLGVLDNTMISFVAPVDAAELSAKEQSHSLNDVEAQPTRMLS
ncbi:hypothetical protein P171DRAFT_483712 [Karstenula rhodostoma CBS 690.94]|uniref:Uncharacterized protein n=1 Tax=Karstenula rhodostoma CBS 690.94 TaxID=1392251 RepID=A0A9P4PLW9_9PLEO|nr:hypothetical protein P171DRAFT_483712 [Karstenula rhodostoma CBS 690.94]